MDKYAYEKLMGLTLNKQANLTEEMVSRVGSGIVYPIGYPLTTAGHLTGLADAADADPKAALKKLNESDKTSYIPGVGEYRLARRVINTNKLYGSEYPRTRELMRNLLGAASITVPAAIGAGVGHMIGKAADPKGPGAIIGTGAGMIVGGLGAAVAHVVGAVAAGIHKRRTDDEQRKAIADGNAKFIIPGYATYDYFKTLGKSRDIK